MTFRTETDDNPDPGEPEADQLCLELQSQLKRARALMDQSRRLITACASEPRSFAPRED